MSNPYTGLPNRAFWRSAVADVAPDQITDIYRPKFSLGAQDRFASAGSCFAQHVGRHLRERGLDYLDMEPPPPFLPAGKAGDFGYGLFSARFGNVYTARQLIQLFERAYGRFVPADDIWTKGDRFYDAFRPAIEPSGFGTREEVAVLRAAHLAAVRQMFERMGVFVFTLGLTETWLSKLDGAAYPVCPGVAAGEFDPARYEFHNFGVSEVVEDLHALIAGARKINPGLKIILTVSPVPLTATASGDHVLVATMRSKAILRAAADEIEKSYDFVDYFPSFELVFGPHTKGSFFEPNLRSVRNEAVGVVMSHFFKAHGLATGAVAATPKAAPPRPAPQPVDIDDLVCEEAMLAEYAPK